MLKSCYRLYGLIPLEINRRRNNVLDGVISVNSCSSTSIYFAFATYMVCNYCYFVGYVFGAWMDNL